MLVIDLLLEDLIVSAKCHLRLTPHVWQESSFPVSCRNSTHIRARGTDFVHPSNVYINISVILCDTDIEVYEDHLSKIQFRLAKVLLEMLHGDMLLDVGQGSSNLFPDIIESFRT